MIFWRQVHNENQNVKGDKWTESRVNEMQFWREEWTLTFLVNQREICTDYNNEENKYKM